MEFELLVTNAIFTMNIFKMFQSQNSLKKKILDIKEDIKKKVSSICTEKLWIDWYGAYEIDPKYLVYWICVETDVMKLKLKADNQLMNDLRYLLQKHKYPTESIDSVIIDVESQETVDRESKGNWYHHFK